MPLDRNAMDRMRADLIRRARLERVADLEQGRVETERPSQHPEMGEHSRDIPRRFSSRRSRLSWLFASGAQPEPPMDEVVDDLYVASPKSPGFNLGTSGVPLAHRDMPNLDRTWTVENPDLRQHPAMARSPSLTGTAWGFHPDPDMPLPPQPTAMPSLPLETSAFDASDPADIHLARLAEEGRRRRHAKKRSRDERRPSHTSRRKPPRRFMLCIPWVKSRRVRSHIVLSSVSGLFLFCLLATYLGLSAGHDINTDGGQVAVVLILIVLIATLFFLFSLIRLCVLIFRKDRRRQHRTRMADMVTPGGYAVPRKPIRIVLPQEEVAGSAAGASPEPTPPEYGRWRGSVRVDPDRFFWQRNEDVPPMPPPAAVVSDGAGRRQARPGERSVPRPPSYASDDGVSYVVEAAPRSVAPTVDVPLPPHPSEAGRVGSMAASSVYSAVRL